MEEYTYSGDTFWGIYFIKSLKLVMNFLKSVFLTCEDGTRKCKIFVCGRRMQRIMTSVDLFEMWGLLDELKVRVVVEEPWHHFDHYDWISEICDYNIFVGLVRSLTEDKEKEFDPAYVYDIVK